MRCTSHETRGPDSCRQKFCLPLDRPPDGSASPRAVVTGPVLPESGSPASPSHEPHLDPLRIVFLTLKFPSENKRNRGLEKDLENGNQGPLLKALLRVCPAALAQGWEGPSPTAPRAPAPRPCLCSGLPRPPAPTSQPRTAA